MREWLESRHARMNSRLWGIADEGDRLTSGMMNLPGCQSVKETAQLAKLLRAFCSSASSTTIVVSTES
jgi:hypothetical protein